MTHQEAVNREYVRIVGGDWKDVEWILAPTDTWYRNPFYEGLPGRHPEDDRYEDNDLVEVCDDCSKPSEELLCYTCYSMREGECGR